MKKLFIPLSLLFLLTGCISQATNKDGEPNNGNEQTPNTEGEPSEENQKGQRVVNFYDGAFIGQLEHESVQSKLKDYINGDTGLLSSISFTGKSEAKESEFGSVVNNEAKKETYVVWWLGSSSNTGELTMNFNFDITSIKLDVQAYYKPYTDHWSNPGTISLISGVDTNAKLFIDSKDNVYDLSVTDSEAIPDIKTITVDYESPVKSITLGNLEVSERVYIHKIEFEYQKNN